MKENVVKIKSFDFALRIVRLCEYLRNTKNEFVLSKQILRSGTAIGALVREAEQGESKLDFVHKLSVALKEANETDYWLDLLGKSNYLKESEYSCLKADCEELLKLLVSIIKSSKQANAK